MTDLVIIALVLLLAGLALFAVLARDALRRWSASSPTGCC